MSRKLMAILVSSALVFGNMSTSAWSASDTAEARQTQAVQTVKNESPLPPAGAAGIKQAQGFDEDSPWLGLGLVAAAVIIGWLLLDDDDDDDTTSTGT